METLGEDVNKYIMEKDGKNVSFKGLAVYFGIPLLLIIFISLSFIRQGEEEAIGAKERNKVELKK